MRTEADPLDVLMQRYGGGEDGVFDELYRLLSPRLYRFCMRLAMREPEAEDLFQETLLRVHRARATYLAGTNPLHWAFAISRSAYYDRLRYRRRRPEDLGTGGDAAEQKLVYADESSSPEALAVARDLQEVVTLELRKMSEKNRIAYVLLKEEGLSVKEAAAVLGTTGAAVRQRAHRAYEQLRIALGEAGWKEHGNDRSWDAIPVRV